MAATDQYFYQLELDPYLVPFNPETDTVLQDIGAFGDHAVIGNYLKPVHESFIDEYIRNTSGPTHGYTLEYVQAFLIDRPEDKKRFRSELKDKRLLWHGTGRSNICKILQYGFDIKMAKKHGMFGPGIYFADCVTKSAGYAGPCWPSQNLFIYMLLCEVALGKIKVYQQAARTANIDRNGANSACGEGYYRSSTAKYWTDEVNNEEVMICPGPLTLTKNRGVLQYNEFVVYDTNQISLRYLVKMRRCFAPCFDEERISVPAIPTTINGSLHYPYFSVKMRQYLPKDVVEHNTTRKRCLTTTNNTNVATKRGRTTTIRTSNQRPHSLKIINNAVVMQPLQKPGNIPALPTNYHNTTPQMGQVYPPGIIRQTKPFQYRHVQSVQPLQLTYPYQTVNNPVYNLQQGFPYRLVYNLQQGFQYQYAWPVQSSQSLQPVQSIKTPQPQRQPIHILKRPSPIVSLTQNTKKTSCFTHLDTNLQASSMKIPQTTY